MNILEELLNAQDGGAVKQLGQQFGLGDEQTAAALASLVPALAAGFTRNAQQDGGLAGLTAALSSGRHSQYLDDPRSLGRAETAADGNGILGHIFGSKDVSRQVATSAARSSGVSPDILKMMLPVVAAMMMGTMAKRAGGPALPAGLGAAPGGDLMSMLTPMLDANRDGSAVDDVVGMLGKLLGSR